MDQHANASMKTSEATLAAQRVTDNFSLLQATTRLREIGGSFSSRRGHTAQISISDTSHHVTEAIGDMYGDDQYSPSKRDSRPLSFITSPLSESPDNGNSYLGSNNSTRVRPSPINGKPLAKAQTAPAAVPTQRKGSLDPTPPLSPSLSLRESSPSETANTQFPLNDLDYESNPAAVAQELSNLQALRRMSMDVGNTSDPDLPSFQNVSLMPSVAPRGNDDEDDPSRLFWVPARVHPELAPMEFKTFLENRVNSIKRRSGEQQSLSPDGLDPSGAGGGLKRKKSMLSRQIDNTAGRGAIGYTDGAEQLERKKSLANSGPELKVSLEQLVMDPANAMKQLTLETNRQDMGGEVPANDDMPILPAAPGIGLRRSTHTTYRRGSLRKGERVPFSKRAGSLRGGTTTDTEETAASSPIDGRSSIGYPLTKVQSEPSAAENFSRPTRGARRVQTVQQGSSIEPSPQDSAAEEESAQIPQPGQLPRSQTFPRNELKQEVPVPKIVETPPESLSETKNARQQFPERSSSQTAAQPPPPPQQQAPPEPPARSSKRPQMERQNASITQPSSKVVSPSQTLNDMVQNPSLLPGSSARTDSLTFIPTYEEKKHSEKKSKKDDSESTISKKSWGWFKGSDDKEKKEKKKEADDKEVKKGKTKSTSEKSHDNARLDVLQSSIDTGSVRGRESLVLERETIDGKLQEERKKESSRKSSGEVKKEKDGLFSSFFGSSKKKGDRDSVGKKSNPLPTLSPELPHRELKPDIDYNWTRFSILEERAIYRMAHIKLANPRRALYSQVLLSNFMYSYLAKVQQMHPQLQVPMSPAQKREEEERRRKEQEEQYQQQLQQQQEQYQYDYHRGISQYAEPQENQRAEGVNYVDDSQIYDYDHQDDDNGHRPQNENGYDESQHYGHQDYYQYDQRHHEQENEDEGDMW
ncbi:hypothetical protein B7463_g1223, partial [Scytalidium lignicola]